MTIHRISRRALLRYGALAGAALTVPGAFPAGAQTAEPKMGGSLRVAIAGGGSVDTLNAQGVVSSGMDSARQQSLYSQFWRIGPDGALVPDLAEEATANDTADEWTLRLKPGLTFHNGRPVTPEDVMFTFRRILDPQVAAPGAAYLRHIDLEGMTAVDERTVRFKLKTPFAPFKENLTELVMLVPQDYDPANPVGTGPFKFKSFTPGQQSIFERFENYHGDGPYVDELVLVDIDDDAARVNALLSGQVEAIAGVPYAQMPIIEGSGTSSLLVSKTGALRMFTMRVDLEPFNDPRVREAVRLVADRPQLVELAFSGQGRIGNDVPSPFDPCYNTGLPQRATDIERAKQLLKDAGKEGLTVELVTAPVQAGLVEMSQVLAEQARAAGITINVRQVDPGTFYGEQYLQWPFAVDWYPSLTYLKQVALSQASGAPFNETHWKDDEYEQLYLSALSTVDNEARCKIVQKMQDIEYQRGGNLIFGFPDLVDAYSNTVTGFVPHVAGASLSYFAFERVSFV